MIKLICGPMFSGKSESLTREIVRCTYAKKKILFIRPTIDNRGYITHSNDDFKITKAVQEGSIDCIYVAEFCEAVIEDILQENYNIIFIDEYFMIKNNRLFLETVLKTKKDIDICLAGLIADSDAKLFVEAVQVLPLCDEIEKLNGVCIKCGSMLGNYSYYKGIKTNQIEVGDSKYDCICGKCYYDENDGPEINEEFIEKTVSEYSEFLKSGFLDIIPND